MTPPPKTLKRIVRSIVALVHPRRVILFGSRARGDARPDSDWDLMVVVPEGVHRLHTALKLHGRVRAKGWVCDFLVATPGDFERYGGHPSLVYRRVLEEGVEIYAA